MKNSRMNKFFLCFRPVTDEEPDTKQTTTKNDRHVSNSITVRRLRNPEKLNHHRRISSILASRISREESQEPSISCCASKQRQGTTEQKNMMVSGFSVGLCFLILLSLTMTVLCGRTAAILVTSTWLYFFPGREGYDRRRRNNFKLQISSNSIM